MASQDLIHHYYPESKFGGFSDLDGTVIFYSRLNALLGDEDTVLDVGCGRGEYEEDIVSYRRTLRTLKGKCKKVIGIDVDKAAVSNRCVDEVRLIQTDRWPVDDESVDVCLADFVVEHLADPEAFFGEVRRVLTPGGVFCGRTTNAWGYVGIGSRLIPNRYHSRCVDVMQEERAEEDVFPTVYRCNSVWKLRRLLNRDGLRGHAYGFESEPRYLEFSSLAYFCGTLYQKVVPQPFKSCIFFFAQKDE